MIQRNQFMRTKLNLLLLALALMVSGVSLLGPTGCQTGKLEPGGPYAPTNQMADLGLFRADSAYLLAYNALDTVFKIEQDNRKFLWGLSPDIKKTLDSIRPQAVLVRNEYAAAREAYLKAPTAEGLTTLQSVLGRIQQLVNAAEAVIQPHKP